jgi:hypothetical protein
MPAIDIARVRLYNQRLAGNALETPADVVAWLGAVQSQEYLQAKWALGLRLQNATDDLIEQAFTNGDILRTHVMRPTWHFVAPDDIRWLLTLTAPRVNIVNGYRYRQLELDEALFPRSNDIITKALQGGQQLTRVELAAVLERAGINAEGQRLAYIVMRAELDGVICSGPRRGRQLTYMLLDERVPPGRMLERDEALVELTTRFFTRHGPALVRDFTWWSGLTMADAKAAFNMADGQLAQTEMDGRTYWHAAELTAPAGNAAPTAHLLPPFDEYTNYQDYNGILDPAHTEAIKHTVFSGMTAIDGQIVGLWRRTFKKGVVVIESAPLRPFSAAEKDAFAAAAEQLGRFLQMPVVLA